MFLVGTVFEIRLYEFILIRYNEMTCILKQSEIYNLKMIKNTYYNNIL